MTLSDMGLQAVENKVLSRGIIGISAPILTETTIRKSQLHHPIVVPDVAGCNNNAVEAYHD
jgi:hypothetical protein